MSAASDTPGCGLPRRVTRRDALRFAAGTLFGVLAYTAPANAETERVVRMGLLLNSHLAEGVDAFVAEIGSLGYAEGRNLVLDWRLIETAERNAALAAELVAAKPDILIGAGTQQVEALKRAAGSIPIVFAYTGDPVGQGLVASLARPGANVTGIASFTLELAAKRLEIISEVKPGIRRVAMLFNPSNPLSVATLRETEAAATARGIALIPVSVRAPAELASALRRIVDDEAEALIGGADIMIVSQTSSIIGFAAERRLPTIFAFRRDVWAGGLMFYGSSPTEGWRRAAQLVGKILSGSKPADLPVEQPVKFELMVNLKTAKALGLVIPSSILARVDEVIE